MTEKNWVFIGLGNLGPQFERTRHNAGFDIMHLLARQTEASEFQVLAPEIPALVSVQDARGILFAKPTTGMNDSGLAIAALQRHFDVPLPRLVIVYDDVSLPLGSLKFQLAGSAGGHHGIENAIEHLGDRGFHRLRVGVGPDPGGAKRFEFVLTPVSGEIAPHYDRVLAGAAQAALFLAEHGATKAMNTVNGKKIA